MSNSIKSAKYKHKEMKVGDRVVLLSDIENGLLKLTAFDEGSIIYLQSQVRATVWFRRIGLSSGELVTEALQLDTNYHKNGRLDGIAVELKRESFAIEHRYSSDFEELVVDEDTALTIPFFTKIEDYRMASNTQRNVGGVFEVVHQYYINNVIDVVSDGFDDWVSETLKMRKINKREKENGDFPEDWDSCLTDKSSNLFYRKKREIELAFSKATGIYYEFTGGLLFD